MKGVILLLGSPNNFKGELSSISEERINRAFKEYKSNPGFQILLTGGFGEHFNTTDLPHAHYAKMHLLHLGVPEKDFLEFAISSNTVEDALFSKPIIENLTIEKIIVVTSDFHVERVKTIFESIFPKCNIEFSSSLTVLPTSQLKKLKSHESQALKRFKQN